MILGGKKVAFQNTLVGPFFTQFQLAEAVFSAKMMVSFSGPLFFVLFLIFLFYFSLRGVLLNSPNENSSAIFIRITKEENKIRFAPLVFPLLFTYMVSIS